MDVRLPNLGEGADSGAVVSILVNEGDQITKGQNLLELENGKAVVPIPSPAAGKISSLRIKAGDKISVGQVLLTLEGASGEAAPAAAKATKPSKPAPAKAARPQAEPEPEPEEEDEETGETADAGEELSGPEPAAAPSIRKIARDIGLDLRRLKGSERGGRVVLDDIRAYIARLQRLAAQPKGKKGAAPVAEQIDFSKWGSIAKRPMTPLRKMISQRMVESWTTIPHVTQFDEADISRIMELRKKHKAAYEAKGANLTVTVFVLKAVVETLKKHPIFNSSIDEVAQEIVFKEYFHIGMAVDTEAGLIVPVIRDVDKKDLVSLARDLADLAGKTRDRKVSMEDLTGGSFTISNQGGIGGAHFTPIVNKPEVAILGLGRGVVKPVVRNGKIEPATMLPVCISYDHRIIDGGAAARFTKDLLEAFENFKEEDVKL